MIIHEAISLLLKYMCIQVIFIDKIDFHDINLSKHIQKVEQTEDNTQTLSELYLERTSLPHNDTSID